MLNVSAALATVHRLGLPLEPALAAAATLAPVDHRLQPVPTGNAITVIDDSYNANPVGVHNGLEVLAELDARQRILVTPGLVELGPWRRRRTGATGSTPHASATTSSSWTRARRGRCARGFAPADGHDHVHVVRSPLRPPR